MRGSQKLNSLKKTASKQSTSPLKVITAVEMELGIKQNLEDFSINILHDFHFNLKGEKKPASPWARLIDCYLINSFLVLVVKTKPYIILILILAKWFSAAWVDGDSPSNCGFIISHSLDSQCWSCSSFWGIVKKLWPSQSQTEKPVK